jgi:hypothetical protein
MFSRAYIKLRRRGKEKGKGFFLALCFSVSLLLCFFQSSCFAEGESSGDEITGGFRFASPGAGDQYRWKVEGDRARFISKDVIEISPVKAIVWSEKESEYLIKADWARLDKTTKDIWTDSPVEIIKGNSKMTGVGLKWFTAKKRVRILKDVKMTLDLGEAKQWQFK